VGRLVNSALLLLCLCTALPPRACSCRWWLVLHPFWFRLGDFPTLKLWQKAESSLAPLAHPYLIAAAQERNQRRKDRASLRRQVGGGAVPAVAQHCTHKIWFWFPLLLARWFDWAGVGKGMSCVRALGSSRGEDSILTLATLRHSGSDSTSSSVATVSWL
jgi:hypothetical protein